MRPRPELIKLWGGEYSMIFGHVQFDGTGLDPRYQYVTLLRDPIERALSQMFFTLNNHRRTPFRNGALTKNSSLPEGRYRVGFAFLEPSPDGMRTLAWCDRVLSFQTRIVREVPSIGACNVTGALAHRWAIPAAPAPLAEARRGFLGRFRDSVQWRRAGS